MLFALTASAQYQPQRDYQRYGGQHQRYEYRTDQQSLRSAIENTLADNNVAINTMLSADKWNYYAKITFSGFQPPSPETLFPSMANLASDYNRYADASHDPVSFTTWWNAILPYLQNSDY